MSHSPARPQRQNPRESVSSRNFLWIGVGAAALLFIVVAVIVWQRTSFPFEFVGGEASPLIVLGNPEDVEYQIKFTGDQPADLERVLVQLESPDHILHVDVQQVTVIANGQEVAMDTSGRVPEGTSVTLQPEEEFTVRVTYFGDSIGAHYVYGFRLGYNASGIYNENALNIKDREFIVNVE